MKILGNTQNLLAKRHLRMTQDTKPKDDQKLGLDLKSPLTLSYFFKHILSFLSFLPSFTTVVKVQDFLWLLRVEQQQSIIAESGIAKQSIIAFFHFFPQQLGGEDLQ